MNPNEHPIRNNAAANRFEVEIDGLTAVTEYRLKPGRIIFTHTEVPHELEGKGIANMLARAALDYARGDGLRVHSTCPFISAFIERHAEYQDLLDRSS